MMQEYTQDEIKQRVMEVEQEHRELDQRIASMLENPFSNQFEVRRLKKRKLALKDMLDKLRSELIPDLNA
jgi:hypothetical protein